MFDGGNREQPRGGGGPAACQEEVGNTALHFACGGNVAVLGKLLAVPGLLVNKKNNWGTTLIMVAAMNGRTHTVRFMVDAVVDDGKTLEDLVHK